MTKSARREAVLPALALLTLAALVVAPCASAHGAAPAREVDTRVLFDDDGLVAYGGCLGPAAEAGGCLGAATGLDLLVLDVREAFLGAEPALVLRMVWQTDAPAAGQGLVLRFEAAGAQHELAATSADGATFSSTQFDRLDGPFDAFDGHPKALDGWLTLSRLGLSVGDDVSAITLASTADGQPDDLMPGGWMLQGQEVQHVPEEPDPGHVTELPGPGTYVVRGPAPLITLTPAEGVLDGARSANLTLRLTNPLTAMAQKVTLDVVASVGVLATLDRSELTLDPGATREVTFRLANGTADGQATVVATSDLGGRATSNLTVAAPPRVIADGGVVPSGDGAPDAKDTPAPAAVAVLLALGAAGVRRR